LIEVPSTSPFTLYGERHNVYATEHVCGPLEDNSLEMNPLYRMLYMWIPLQAWSFLRRRWFQIDDPYHPFPYVLCLFKTDLELQQGYIDHFIQLCEKNPTQHIPSLLRDYFVQYPYLNLATFARLCIYVYTGSKTLGPFPDFEKRFEQGCASAGFMLFVPSKSTVETVKTLDPKSRVHCATYISNVKACIQILKSPSRDFPYLMHHGRFSPWAPVWTTTLPYTVDDSLRFGPGWSESVIPSLLWQARPYLKNSHAKKFERTIKKQFVTGKRDLLIFEEIL
jgi:hypothetical protein